MAERRWQAAEQPGHKGGAHLLGAVRAAKSEEAPFVASRHERHCPVYWRARKDAGGETSTSACMRAFGAGKRCMLGL